MAKHPLRADPSRTATLRRRFDQDLTKRFNRIWREVKILLIEEDVFGLRPTNRIESLLNATYGTPIKVSGDSGGFSYNDSPPIGTSETFVVRNTRWRFRSTDQQKLLFEQWMATQIDSNLLSSSDAYWEKYIEEAYMRGQGRAFIDANKSKLAAGGNLDFFEGSKQEFLNQAFNHPPSVDKVRLLASRTFTDLKGVTDNMSNSMSRLLVDGLIQGQNPIEIARRMKNTITGIGPKRAKTIARTEIIRAHAEGQLDAFERLGVVELGVMTEWSTAGDDRVCPLCQPMDGVVLTVKEGRGMLPRHSNCRCVWIPANVGEPKRGQERGKPKVDRQIRESIKAEIPRKSKRSIAAQRRLSQWVGADKDIAKKRPKSILDTTTIVTKKKIAKKIIKKAPTKKPAPPIRKKAIKPKVPTEITKGMAQTELAALRKQVGFIKFHRMTRDFVRKSKVSRKGFQYEAMANAEDMVSIEIGGIEYVFPDSESMFKRVVGDILFTAENELLPQQILATTKRIVYTLQPNRHDAFWAVQYNTPGFKSAATGGDGTIAVYNGKSVSQSTLAHESGHNFATKVYGTTTPKPGSKYGIAQQLESPVTPYGANSSSEDFAEAVKLYSKNEVSRKAFKATHPKKFEALEELLEQTKPKPLPVPKATVEKAVKKVVVRIPNSSGILLAADEM